MKVLFRERTISSIISSVVCIVFGMVFLIFPGDTTTWICRIIGGFLVLFGVFYVGRFFADKTRLSYFQLDLMLGILLLVLGIWMLATPSIVVGFLQYVFGILVLVHGIVDLQGALHLWKLNVKNWYLSLILGIVTTGLGVLIIANPFESFAALMMLIGVVMIYDGVSDLFILFCIGKLVHREKREQKLQEAAKVVEGTAEEVTDAVSEAVEEDFVIEAESEDEVDEADTQVKQDK